MKNQVLHIRDNVKRRPSASRDNFVPDEKFIEICRKIAKTPKYQYQLLQIVVDLDPDVLVETQKIGLDTKKKSLLTHTKLRNHPKLQM